MRMDRRAAAGLALAAFCAGGCFLRRPRVALLVLCGLRQSPDNIEDIETVSAALGRQLGIVAERDVDVRCLASVDGGVELRDVLSADLVVCNSLVRSFVESRMQGRFAVVGSLLRKGQGGSLATSYRSALVAVPERGWRSIDDIGADALYLFTRPGSMGGYMAARGLLHENMRRQLRHKFVDSYENVVHGIATGKGDVGAVYEAATWDGGIAEKLAVVALTAPIENEVVMVRADLLRDHGGDCVRLAFEGALSSGDSGKFVMALSKLYGAVGFRGT